MDKWTLLLESVRKSWRVCGKPASVLAAVSGGADSVALLHILNVLSLEEGFSLYAAHVDHGMREASAVDAAFVGEICEKLGIPCSVSRIQVEGGSENAAREARYRALYAAAGITGASCIALAHHRRDQAETILLHLIRGCGASGLSGMEEKRMVETEDGREIALWRPLLTLSPRDVRGMLAEKGIPWREDETNATDHYLRNYIRHQVLPSIERRAPEAEAALSRAAIIIRREDDYMTLSATLFLIQYACQEGPCRCIRMQQLMDLHPALRGRVIRMAFPEHMDFETSEKLLWLKKGQQVNLPAGYRALATEKWLHFIPPTVEKMPLGKITVLPFTGDPGDGIRLQAMPRKVWEQAHLAFRRQGERIHPLGGPGNKSLQDYWVDKKVDRPFRAYLPLLCVDQQVIWSIGVGPGEEARVTQGEEMVLLGYEGYLPGEIAGINKE